MTTSDHQNDLRQMASRWLLPHQVPNRFRVLTDTTDYFRVGYDDIVLLDSKGYLIRHNAKEQRFGLEDEVKFWVKRAIDLSTGELKIMKLVFYEKFNAQIGRIKFELFRSPRKEANILNLVQGHKNFMQGRATNDSRGNVVRIIDFIKGKPLSIHVGHMELSHAAYFHQEFPHILDRFMECINAIRFLHENGTKHGDIRRDHILIDAMSGDYRWIDFDYNYTHRENIYGYDLFGLGNVLAFLVGKGDLTPKDLKAGDHPALNELTGDDFNIVFHNRIVNLKKIFPYIPEHLNRVLLHFSTGANWFYENTNQLMEDLSECRSFL